MNPPATKFEMIDARMMIMQIIEKLSKTDYKQMVITPGLLCMFEICDNALCRLIELEDQNGKDKSTDYI